MRTAARNTRRACIAQPPVSKANHSTSGQENVPTPPSRKVRHRLSTAELTRLEEAFKQETHPSRQQKKDLATELGMDYKTVTIWFQNKRQTSKRGQPPVDKLGHKSGRTRRDSCLRAVSSPSHNATLDTSGTGSGQDSTENKGPGERLHTITAKAIDKIKPLLDSLNALTSRPRGHTGSAETRDEAPNVKNIDLRWSQTPSEGPSSPAESDRHDQIVEQDQTKGETVRWKRIRTLEWACERQAKRRRLSRGAYVRLGSEEIQGRSDSNDARMDSALSLLSLASSTQAGPSKDVVRGASLLLSFKHSWRRKQI